MKRLLQLCLILSTGTTCAFAKTDLWDQSNAEISQLFQDAGFIDGKLGVSDEELISAFGEGGESPVEPQWTGGSVRTFSLSG